MERIKYIDGLKGIGALAIVFCHYRLARFFYPASANDWVATNPFSSFFSNGGFWVCIFIIMCGFAAAMSAYHRHIVAKNNANATPGNRGGYSPIINRYLRFVIPIACVLFILYLVHLLGGFFAWKAGALTGSAGLQESYINVSLSGLIKAIVMCPLGDLYGWDNPLWMLPYVFFGYFLAYLLVMTIFNINSVQRLISYGIVAIMLYGNSPYWMCVIIGVMLYDYYIHYGLPSNKIQWLLAIGCFGLFILSRMYLQIGPKTRETIIAVFFVLFVYFCPAMRWLLSTKPFEWLGKVSFFVYLWHWPIMCSLTSYLYLHPIFTNGYVNATILFVTTFLVIYGVAWLSQRYMPKYKRS